LLDALEEVMSTRRIAPSRVPYLTRLITELHDHGAEVNDLLTAALDNWRLERLSVLDRGVLRIAAIEIARFEDIPPKVSIQEAVRLAERYGGADSPGFVNGVLDALYKQVMD
jgi:N utilization substance protein B